MPILHSPIHWYGKRVIYWSLKSIAMELGRVAMSKSTPNTFVSHALYMPGNTVSVKGPFLTDLYDSSK